MNRHVDEASLQIGTDVQVEINDERFRVFNAHFERTFRHSQLPRFYMSRTIYSSNEMIIMNVGDRDVHVPGIAVNAEMHNLVLKFRDNLQYGNFTRDLDQRNYVQIPYAR